MRPRPSLGKPLRVERAAIPAITAMSWSRGIRARWREFPL